MADARTVDLPAEVVDEVASRVGAQVTLLSRLPGGVNGGAFHVQLAGGATAVLKAVPRAHPKHPDETLRAQRVVEHMRRRGYPTPAWLGVGATATHVWHLMDFVDAAPAPELTLSLVEQLMEIIELQAGQASEPYDHWSYAWRVATGHGLAVAGLDFDEAPEQTRLRQSMAGISGIPPWSRPWSSACGAGVPAPHHQERHPTWSMPISPPPATSWSETERWWRS